jgi:hypothetical protein
MKSAFCALFTFALTCLSQSASALALGPEDFLAARSMTCVLAQESLGYLSEDEFSEAAESIMTGYDQSEGDVIYAKAIGYFDGLMFGLPANDPSAVAERLQQFLSSKACTRFTGIKGVSQSL